MNAPARGRVDVIRGNALDLVAAGIADASVDLVVTSPPYFGLRSYQDGGEHYAGQIGAEPTPAEFVDALVAATREMVRVLKPSGSIFVNLGDKWSQRTALRRSSHQDGLQPHMPETAKDWKASRERGEARMARENVTDPATGAYVPEKSLMGLPWRYAIRCIDELGLVLRSEIIWSKPNGLPESVTDRVRRSHETWFHFVKSRRYYANIDTIREPHLAPTRTAGANAMQARNGSSPRTAVGAFTAPNPLGKLPGSVWTVPLQPLKVPAEIGVQHFAAFPMEWPRRFIKGWCPPGICTTCGEGRRSVPADTALDMSRPQARRAHELATAGGLTEDHYRALLSVGVSDTGRGAATQSGTGKNATATVALADHARAVLGGYAREYLLRRPTSFTDVCACPDATAPTAPAVVLDPFGGTGTTATVASALGRHGISVDLSEDYCRLARWRTTDPVELARAAEQEPPRRGPAVPGEWDALDLDGLT